MRAGVCRIMVRTGIALMKRYLKTFIKDTTLAEKLKIYGLTENKTWSPPTEVVLAVSSILNSEAYIAKE